MHPARQPFPLPTLIAFCVCPSPRCCRHLCCSIRLRPSPPSRVDFLTLPFPLSSRRFQPGLSSTCIDFQGLVPLPSSLDTSSSSSHHEHLSRTQTPLIFHQICHQSNLSRCCSQGNLPCFLLSTVTPWTLEKN
ncbi:uncharacterized protein BJX67DRAFT_81833 [Aspergillus lucknowensis]|uniref:Secreted protein n=1 Tax=Aspergillus lucknowensis TaxID=176173 RepID=A0ABR4LRX1_9EURO